MTPTEGGEHRVRPEPAGAGGDVPGPAGVPMSPAEQQGPTGRSSWLRSIVGRSAVPWLFPVGVLVAVVLLGGVLGLNGSSLGIYEVSNGATEEEAGVVAGPPRGIRSDEWYVRTPWVLRQAELGFPARVSGGMGTHDVVILGDLPVKGWEAILRPHTTAYWLFGQERGFAVEWWMFAAVQLVGVYALVFSLTKRAAIAALSASIVTLSPATQWWWAPATFTTIGYGSLATAMFVHAVRSTSTRARVFLSVATGWAIAAFLTTLYLPWQIGTALVLAPVAIGTVVPALRERTERRRAFRALALVLVVSIGLAAALFSAFVLGHRDAVTTIAGTEYPGKEPANKGGTASLPVFFGSAFDYFSSQRPGATVNGTNQSENSSSLVLLLPVATVCIALAAAGRLRDHPLVFPLVGCVLGGAAIVSWMLLPIPGWLAQLALLTRAPPGRMFLPLGFAGVVGLALLITFRLAAGVRIDTWMIAAATVAFAAAQIWGASQYRVDGQPIDLELALAFIFVVSVGVALSLGRRPAVGLAVLTVFTFAQAAAVNPIQRGTAPLTDSALRHAIDRLQGTAPQDAAWVSYSNDATVKGTLTASGVNHVTAVSPYPDERAWRVLDPNGSSRRIWNRYAHVAFLVGEPGTAPAFEFVGLDQLAVTVDPCGPELTALEVAFVVDVESAQPAPCLRPVARIPLGDQHIVVHRRLNR